MVLLYASQTAMVHHTQKCISANSVLQTCHAQSLQLSGKRNPQHILLPAKSRDQANKLTAKCFQKYEGSTYILVILVTRWMVNLKKSHTFKYLKINSSRITDNKRNSIYYTLSHNSSRETGLYGKYGVNYTCNKILWFLFRKCYHTEGC